MPIYRKWFTEKPIPGKRRAGIKHIFKINKVIFRKKTPYHEILIFRNPIYKRIFVLNGILQATELDEFIYHETMAHSVLFSHPKPRSVLIIGGGDGGVLREVIKHPVKNIDLVEIDSEVIASAKKYLRFLHKGAFSDPRLNIVARDGCEFLNSIKDKYDIMIIDSTNFGEKNSFPLFQVKFYRKAFDALTRNGIFITLGASELDFFQFVREIVVRMKKIFRKTFLIRTCIPSFNCGEYFFVIGSKTIDLSKVKIEKRFKNFPHKETLRYFSPEIFKASFCLPPIYHL